MVRKARDQRSSKLTGVDYRKSAPALFKSIEKSDWEKASEICNADNSAASQWVINKDIDGEISWRRLPLHEACMHKPDESLIKKLIIAYPRGVRAVDGQGRLPLHHACDNGAPENMIKMLIMEYPESIDIVDDIGDTPLKIVQASSHPAKQKIIEALEKRPWHYSQRAGATKQTLAEGQIKAFTTIFEERFKMSQIKHNEVVMGLEKVVADLRFKNKRLNRKVKEYEAKAEFRDEAPSIELFEKQREEDMATIQNLRETESALRHIVGEASREKVEMQSKMKELLEKQREEDMATIQNLRETESALRHIVGEASREKVDMQSKMKELLSKSEEKSKVIFHLTNQVNMKGTEGEKIEYIKDVLVEFEKRPESPISEEEEKELRNEVKSLCKSNEKIANRNAELENKIAEYSKKIASMAEAIESLSSKVEEDKETIKSLKTELEDNNSSAQEKISYYENILEQGRIETQAVIKEKYNLDLEIKSLKKNKDTIENKNKVLEMKTRDYSLKIETMEDTINTQESKISELVKDVESLSNTKSCYEEQFAELQQDLSASEHDNQEKDLLLTKLKDEVIVYKLTHKELETTKDELETTKDELGQAQRTVVDQYHELNTLRAEYEDDRIAAERTKTTLTKKNNDLESRVERYALENIKLNEAIEISERKHREESEQLMTSLMKDLSFSN